METSLDSTPLSVPRWKRRKPWSEGIRNWFPDELAFAAQKKEAPSGKVALALSFAELNDAAF